MKKNTGKAPRSNWIKYTVENNYTIEPKPACYVVYLNGKLVYVGQSANTKKRIQNHGFRFGYSNVIYTPWGQADDVLFKVKYTKKYGDWAMIELRLIKRLKPKYNCAGGGAKKRETL